jgi:hypothetical protein
MSFMANKETFSGGVSIRQENPVSTFASSNPDFKPGGRARREGSRTLAERITERHPDWPPLKLKFYFTRHTELQDAVGIKDHVDKTDIYLYEDPTDDGIKPALQAIADADPSIIAFDTLIKRLNLGWTKTTAAETEFRALFGSKKIVGHIDLRSRDPLTAYDIQEALNAEAPDKSGNFEHMLSLYPYNISRTSKLQAQREKIMFGRFELEMQELINIHLELKAKEEINILFTLGASHTPLFHEFRQAGINVERSFSDQPYVYSYEGELRRALLFGVEPTRDLIAKIYLEDEFRTILNKTTNRKGYPNSNESNLYLRQIISVFTTDEIKQIYNQTLRDGALTIDQVNQLLETKGLSRMPDSAQQIHDMLEEQKRTYLAKVARIKVHQ